MKSLKPILAVLCALTLFAGCFTVALAAEEECDHAWGWVVDVEPTCANGSKHMYCPKCGATKDEGTVISATQEHAWEWVVDLSPTETMDGYKHEACKNCDAVRNLHTKIPATRQDPADIGGAILKWFDVIGNFFYSIINQIRAVFDGARA